MSSGFSIVLNEPNTTIPLCPLTARNRRLADEQAGSELRAAGQITKADATKHECGLAHAFTPEDSGKISAVINRLGNSLNLGVHLGLSGFVVINIDNDEQREAFMQAWGKYSDEDIALPTIKTPGTKKIVNGEEKWVHKNSAHWWFRVPSGTELPTNLSRYVTSQGWSILWGESQALVPPSRKPEGNYVLQNEPSELPEWLINFITKIGQNAETTAIVDTPVVGAGEKSPFTIAAKSYREKGWDPFPIMRDKDRYRPFRKGHTGRTGKNLTDEEIDRYASSAYDLGVALRMPRTVIAIDVDGHDGKVGDNTLFNMEYTLGPLPSTYRNTARLQDEVAGHRFFTIPEGTVLIDKVPNKHIDILQFHHRYANVWPTINAKTGMPYRWFDKDGNLMEEGFIPDINDIPELPVAWINHLKKKVDKSKPGRKIDPEDMDDNMRGSGRDIAERSIYKLVHAPPGTRNNQLNTTSYLLGRMVAADVLSVEEAEQMVTDACDQNGLLADNPGEVSATFNSGMNAGNNDPWIPNGLEFVDPEEVIVDEHPRDNVMAVYDVLRAHSNPAITDISEVAKEIIKVCKMNGFTKGQTVTWLYAWSQQAGMTYNGDQISLSLANEWDLADFTKPRMVARDARRVIKRFKFLWENRIPLGGLTFLTGKGEAGKTTLVAWIVAGITNGTLPGSLSGTPRNVLYIRPEGSWSEVLTQFIIADADIDRIKEIVLEIPGGSEKPPTLPDDIPGFKEMCEQYDPALIVFDPLPARMNSTLSTFSDNDIRTALDPLTYLAQERQMAVIGISHLKKDDSDDLINKVMGGVGFVNVARSVMMVIYNSETGERFVGIIKANGFNKTKTPTLRFTIVEDSFEWETEDGWTNVDGTKVEIVGTDDRSIEEVYYTIAAQMKSMRERAGRERSSNEEPLRV